MKIKIWLGAALLLCILLGWIIFVANNKIIITPAPPPPTRMPMHLPGSHPAKTTAEIGDSLFDGHTGNLLVWGVY